MRYLILLLALFIFHINLFAHDMENNHEVHQRIVVEAYKLLKLQFSKEENGFADMDQHIGTATHYGDNYWANVSSIAEGAENEDHNDIIWGYDDVSIFTNYDALKSITHFFDTDNYEPNKKVKLFDNYWVRHNKFPTAFTKAKRFMYDEFTKDINISGEGESWNFQKLIGSLYKDKTSYLSDWYWENEIYVGLSLYSYGSMIYKPGPCDFYQEYDCRKMFYNILGRICHLLTDMGVPEHASRSIHIDDWHAPLEHWLSVEYDTEFYWTAEKVYNERGGFINPFCNIHKSQPRHDPYNIWKDGFLFFTVSQLSDWFVKHGGIPQDGDDYYNLNTGVSHIGESNIGEIESIIRSYSPNGEIFRDPALGEDAYFWGFLNATKWQPNTDQGRAIRDVLLPYTIRAVAGMMYKYIIETKMQYPNDDDGRGFIFKQQPELNLFNQDIDGNHYTFRAESTPGRITVSPENRPAGYPADFTIGSNARNVTFQASNEIIFKPGFSSKAGSEVRAFICEDCNKLNFNNIEGCSECPDYDFNPQYDKSSN